MKKVLFIFLTISITIFPQTLLLAANTPMLKEGLWQITMKTKQSAASGFLKDLMSDQAPFTEEQCLTKKDFIPTTQPPESGQTCKIVSSKVAKNKVSWTVQCTNKMGKSVSTGRIIYKNSSFSGTVDVKNPMMNMSMEMTGKYIGKCQ